MPTPFHTTRFVEFSDTDMAGIVHFSAFFKYMEAAEHELLRSLGFSVYSEVGGEVGDQRGRLGREVPDGAEALVDGFDGGGGGGHAERG